MVCGEPPCPTSAPLQEILAGELEVERPPIRHAAYYETIHRELMLGNLPRSTRARASSRSPMAAIRL
jgi:hypothetical protein